MDREECMLMLRLAFQERRPLQVVVNSGYAYHGVVQEIGGACVYAANGSTLPEGCFRFLMLDCDGELQATVELSAADVQRIIPDEPEASRRLQQYICSARGYGTRLRKIREVVEQLRSRPGMYLGVPSVRALRQYLTGYMTACADVDPLWQDDFAGNAFTLFVCHEYGDEMSGRDWSSLICGRFPDDGSAFEEFLRLFDAFCEE